jgi:hypothetical protein
MGLDQYAFAVMPHKDNTDFYCAVEPLEKIAQWRKHSDLQGYMENLFHKKRAEQGLEDISEDWQVFNCQPLRLTFQDLQDLRKAVTNESLPHTEGFFFGATDEHHYAETLEFLDEADRAMHQDMEIYYDSWW